MRLRSILVGVLVAAALAIALCVALLAAVSFGWQRERLRDWLEARLSQEIGTPITIGALAGPLHRTFELHDVRVTVSDEPLLEIRRVAMTLGRVEIWPRPRVVLAEVSLEGPELWLQRDVAGHWNAEGLAPAEASDAAPEPGPPWLEVRRFQAHDGRLSLTLDSAEAASALAARYALQARDLTFPSAGLPPVAFDVVLEPGRFGSGSIDGGVLRGRVTRDGFELAEARVHGAGFRLEGHGAGTRAGIDALQVVLRVDDLGALAALGAEDVAARGSLAVRGELRGPWERIAGELALTGGALALRGVALGDLEARIHGPGDGSVVLDALQLSGGRLPLRADPGARLRREQNAIVVEGLRLASEEARFALDGRIGRQGFTALRVHAEQVDPAPLAALAGLARPLGGRLAGDVLLDGPFAGPAATGTLQWDEPRIGELRFDALDARFATEADRVEARFGLTLDAAPALTGRAELPRGLPGASLATLLEQPGFALDLELRPLSIRRIAPLLPESARSLDGRIQGALTLRGGSPWPVIQRAHLTAEEVARPGETPRDLDLVLASSEDGAVNIEKLLLVQGERRLAAAPGGRLRPRPRGVAVEDLSLLVDGQRIELSGGVTAEGFDDLRLQTRGYDPASLIALLGVREPVAGRLDVDLALSGAHGAPSVRGELAFSDARVGEIRFDRLELAVETPDERIRARGTLQRAGRELMDLHASVPRELARLWPDGSFAAEALELAVEAQDLELALFAPLLPASLRKPTGTLRGRLRLVDGRPQGSLELVGGGLTAPGFGRLEPIVARLQLDDTALRIQHFRIGGEQGEAKLTGRIELAELRPRSADLELVLDRFAVSQPGLWRSSLSGRVEAVGEIDALRTRGELLFGALRVEVPSAQDPTLKEIRIVTGDGGDGPLREDAEPGVFERASVDVRIEVPENSWVRGGGAELEVAGTLRLTKPPLEPLRYDGRLRAVRGGYRLHGKRFELRRGSASLVADTELDPELDVEAVHRVGDVAIVARVSGRASAPEVRLESEPPLPDADVLSYLLFGRSSSEVAGGQQPDLTAAATRAAAGIAAGELQTLLSDLLPVDTVDIRIQENGGPAELGVGKYLGDRIFVRYGRSLGVEPEDRVGVEVKLTPSWSLESDVSSSGSAGADLIWNYDY